MNLRQRLLKNSNLATMLEDSDIFKGTDFTPTQIPILDIALSGEIGKGLTRGLTIFAGPSKHFKSLMGLILVRRYMEEHLDATCLFYDSEWGTTEDYFKGTGIDTKRVIHVGVATLEELRGEVATALKEEDALLGEQRRLIVHRLQLRDPVDLAIRARALGFRPHARALSLPEPTIPGLSLAEAIGNLPAVGARPTTVESGNDWQ